MAPNKLNAFSLFVQEVREELKRSGYRGSMDWHHIKDIASQRWQQLSLEEHQEYKNRAKRNKGLDPRNNYNTSSTSHRASSSHFMGSMSSGYGSPLAGLAVAGASGGHRSGSPQCVLKGADQDDNIRLITDPAALMEHFSTKREGDIKRLRQTWDWDCGADKNKQLEKRYVFIWCLCPPVAQPPRYQDSAAAATAFGGRKNSAHSVHEHSLPVELFFVEFSISTGITHQSYRCFNMEHDSVLENDSYIASMNELYRRLHSLFMHRGRLFCLYAQWEIVNSCVQQMNRLYKATHDSTNISVDSTSSRSDRVGPLKPMLKLPGEQLFCLEDLLISLLNWHEIMPLVKHHAAVGEWHDTDALVELGAQHNSGHHDETTAALRDFRQLALPIIEPSSGATTANDVLSASALSALSAVQFVIDMVLHPVERSEQLRSNMSTVMEYGRCDRSVVQELLRQEATASGSLAPLDLNDDDRDEVYADDPFPCRQASSFHDLVSGSHSAVAKVDCRGPPGTLVDIPPLTMPPRPMPTRDADCLTFPDDLLVDDRRCRDPRPPSQPTPSRKFDHGILCHRDLGLQRQMPVGCRGIARGVLRMPMEQIVKTFGRYEYNDDDLSECSA